jgi:hypothetical protein
VLPSLLGSAWCGRGPSEIFEPASVCVDRIEIVFSFSLVMYALSTSFEMATSCAPAPVGSVATATPELASKMVTSPLSRFTTQTVPARPSDLPSVC